MIHWGDSKEQHCKGVRMGRMGQREKLPCDAGTTEDSALLMGSCRVGWPSRVVLC